MTSTPRAFATFDIGGATTATALIAMVEGRWRLLGSLAGPVAAPADLLLGLLAQRVCSAAPDLADAIGLTPPAALDLPRVTARSVEPGTIAILAASERALASLISVVARSGWRWLAASAEREHAQALTAVLLDPVVSAVLVAAADPPGGDERGHLTAMGALVAAAAVRRPELTVILAGSMTHARTRFGLPAERASRRHLVRGSRARTSAGAPAWEAGGSVAGGWLPEGWLASDPAGDDASKAGPTARVLLAPRAASGAPAWGGLTALLVGLRREAGDSRHGIAAAAMGLAGALDRRVEVVEIGFNGGLRASGVPGPSAGAGTGAAIASADAALVPPDIDEARLERVQGWSTLPFDRHRLRDRLMELRAAPWSGAAGDGATLRLVAARAAMARLVELTPELDDGPNPDLLVLAGGPFASAPAAAILLAAADVIRRPAAVQVMLDHARLLGPLGTIEDPAERDRLLADLSGDLLAPLGSIVMPAGIRAGRRSGRVIVDGPSGVASMGLDAGALDQVPLAPGRQAFVTLESSEPFVLGARGRRISVELAGGVAGLLLDLRGVPLRLPDRRELRREQLARWQDAAWPEAGR